MQHYWSAWHWWLYLLLITASGLALADAYLPPVKVTSTIAKSSDFEVSFSTRHAKNIELWSVVSMANGSKFQVSGGPEVFIQGDTLHLEITPLLNEVLRFAKHPGPRAYWTELAEREKEYDLFPALVLLCSVLLLIPFRAVVPRWYLHGMLLMGCAAWLITMIGMGGLRPWG